MNSWHGLCIRVAINPINPMKQNTLSAESVGGFESTYALLVRSEEKERSMFEGAAYLVFVLSAVFSIWQMVHQPVELPKGGVIRTSGRTVRRDTAAGLIVNAVRENSVAFSAPIFLIPPCFTRRRSVQPAVEKGLDANFVARE